MKKQFNYMVFVGRMSPPHKAHIDIIKKALTISDKVIIMIGSAYQPRTIKNPWTWKERKEMIRACFPPEVQDSLAFFGISDVSNDQTWVRTVQDNVERTLKNDRKKTFEENNQEISAVDFDPKIGLIGHDKDDSTYYLKMFPQWKFNEVSSIDDMNATDIRRMMFELEQLDKTLVPVGVVDFIEAFMNSDNFEKLKDEFAHIKKYQTSWAKAPYAPTFVTVDSVVVQAGHVLLIKRRAAPGLGLWALPGGFLNQNEKIEDGALRELREETKLKVPLPVLKGNIKAVRIFDAPNRSLRGRTITHAHYIELPPGALPKVKGGDDAEKAKWVSFGTFQRMQDQMFEDHYLIINHFIGG